MERQKAERCYLYTRVSTEMQIDGYSLDAQEETLRKFADFRNMKVVRVYTDAGKSGKNISGRPQFKQMMDDIGSGKDKVSYVLVFKLSRFGRNTADILTSLDYMESYGVNLYCVEDNIDSSGSAGRLIISVLSAVAEIERENIRDQAMAGRLQKAREGRWNGGAAPYGYRIDYSDGISKGKLVIKEDEAEIVKRVYDMYLEGDGTNTIAKKLYAEGYRKEIRTTDQNDVFSASMIKTMLDNPVYMGKIVYGRRPNRRIPGKKNEYKRITLSIDDVEMYDGLHEAIIPEDEWYKVRAIRRSRNKHYAAKADAHPYVLSGLIRCPVCGDHLIGVRDTKKRSDGTYYKTMWYYICKKRHMVCGRKCDFIKHIRQKEINAEIFAIMKNVLSNPVFMESVVKSAGVTGDLSEQRSELERLNALYDKTVRKKQKMLQKISRLDPDDDFYDDMYSDLENLLRDYTKEINALRSRITEKEYEIDQASAAKADIAAYRAFFNAALKNFEILPAEDLRDLVHLLIEEIEIFPEKNEHNRWVKKVRFKIPLNFDGHRIQDVDYYDTDGDEGGFGIDEDDPDHAGFFLTRKDHVETVCLLSKKK